MPKKEYRSKKSDDYHKTKKAKKDRAKRNKARRMMERAGKVSKGDGKDVDHTVPLRNGGGNGKKNLRVTSKKKNRGYKRKGK